MSCVEGDVKAASFLEFCFVLVELCCRVEFFGIRVDGMFVDLMSYPEYALRSVDYVAFEFGVRARDGRMTMPWSSSSMKCMERL